MVPNPDADKGFVPGIGAHLGIDIEPGVDDISGGVTDPDDSFYASLTVEPLLKLYYFVTHRFSPYINIVSTFDYLLLAKVNDTKLDMSFEERMYFRMNVFVGFTYHIPNRDAAVIKTK